MSGTSLEIGRRAAGPGPTAPPEPARGFGAGDIDVDRGHRLARIGAVTLALALAVWAFAPFVLTALDAARHHRIFLGVSGYFPWDGLQYLAFVRDGHGGLIPNLYGGTGAPVFVHPMWSTTAIVQGLTGVGPAAIMAFWKLVALAVLFAGAAWLVARHVPASSPARRGAALVLCLFGGLTPCAAFLFGPDWGEARVAAIDLVPAVALWDYAPIAIAIGLMPFAIEGLRRIVYAGASWRRASGTAAGSLVIGWLHPWQGATLLLALLGLVVWRARECATAGGTGGGRTSVLAALGGALSGRVRPLVMVVAAAAAGPAYYTALSRVDGSWAYFSKTDADVLHISPPVLVYCVAPLVLVACWGAWASRRDRDARGIVVWPLATLVLVALAPPEQYHALDGVALPLAVLVARAWPAGRRALCLGRLAAGAGLAATVATLAVLAGTSLTQSLHRPFTAYSELAPSDGRAVEAAARAAGDAPILSTQQLGSAIPMLVDHATWVGNVFWTRNIWIRRSAATSLFEGQLVPADARALVRSTGARAIVEPCGAPARLEPALRPLGFRERVLGCARVYTRGGDSRRGRGGGALSAAAPRAL